MVEYLFGIYEVLCSIFSMGKKRYEIEHNRNNTNTSSPFLLESKERKNIRSYHLQRKKGAHPLAKVCESLCINREETKGCCLYLELALERPLPLTAPSLSRDVHTAAEG